jgi:hypothetical protein
VLLAFLATLVAVVASALLPFAPDTVNKSTVSRPRDRPHRRHQRHGGSDVETAAFDRPCRHAGFDQRDPPAVHDLMVGRRRDRHGPAEMIGDAHAHASEHALADTNLDDEYAADPEPRPRARQASEKPARRPRRPVERVALAYRRVGTVSGGRGADVVRRRHQRVHSCYPAFLSGAAAMLILATAITLC